MAVTFFRRARLLRSWAQVKALGEREAHLVGVGGDVGGVDQQHILRLRADAAHVAIGDLWLDHMAQVAVIQAAQNLAPGRAGGCRPKLQNRCGPADRG